VQLESILTIIAGSFHTNKNTFVVKLGQKLKSLLWCDHRSKIRALLKGLVEPFYSLGPGKTIFVLAHIAAVPFARYAAKDVNSLIPLKDNKYFTIIKMSITQA